MELEVRNSGPEPRTYQHNHTHTLPSSCAFILDSSSAIASFCSAINHFFIVPINPPPTLFNTNLLAQSCPFHFCPICRVRTIHSSRLHSQHTHTHTPVGWICCCFCLYNPMCICLIHMPLNHICIPVTRGVGNPPLK